MGQCPRISTGPPTRKLPKPRPSGVRGGLAAEAEGVKSLARCVLVTESHSCPSPLPRGRTRCPSSFPSEVAASLPVSLQWPKQVTWPSPASTRRAGNSTYTWTDNTQQGGLRAQASGFPFLAMCSPAASCLLCTSSLVRFPDFLSAPLPSSPRLSRAN